MKALDLIGQGLTGQAAVCRNKKAFESRRLAKAYSKNRHHGKRATHIYSCPVCGLWHTTSSHNDDGFNNKIDWRGFPGGRR